MHKKTRSLDLNLLNALRILLEERSVTRGAERLHVSQPAMSKTLQKLRSYLNDPLFTRSPHGLIPTPRAKQLESSLPNLLDQLGALVNTPEFNPQQHKSTFTIAGSELLFGELIPRLIGQVQKQSSDTTIRATEIRPGFLDELADGTLDFAIHTKHPENKDLISVSLGGAQSICAMRAEHPLAKQRALSIEDYLTFPHVRLYLVQITPSDTGVVDELLAQSGKQRKIILETSKLSIALEVIAASDALLVIPSKVAALTNELYICKPLPAKIEFPSLDTILIQHKRTTFSPAHQWLKNLIVDIQGE